jgi:hypothetical protein
MAGTFERDGTNVGFASFMSSAAGRLLRVVAGVALIATGYGMHSPGGVALAIVGVLPLATGLFDVCLAAPLFGAPIRGRDVRHSN